MEKSNGLEKCFELCQVRKTYGNTQSNNGAHIRPALNISDLVIFKRQTTAILGYSGSGKSTLLNLLSLLDLPDNNGGEILFDGQSYAAIRNNEFEKNRFRRNAFGFVFQDNHLLEHLNSIRNVGLGLALRGLPLRVCDQKAQELLEKVGIGEKARSLPSELSGGEKQRVAVMRAILHNPDVVFADEPTGNLDWDTGLAVMERLGSWREETSNTMIIVSHNLHQVFDFSDRFIILKDGKVIFKGFHAKFGKPPVEGEEVVEGPERLTEVLRLHSSVHPLKEKK